jgi:hypothetical protein
MYYLADFKYQEPDKRYWKELDRRITKDENYEPFYKSGDRYRNYQRKDRTFRTWEKLNRRLTVRAAGITPKRKKELIELNDKLYDRTRERRDKFNTKDGNLAENFRERVDKFVSNIKETRHPYSQFDDYEEPITKMNEKVKDVVNKTKSKKGLGLGKKALIGTLGLGAIAYGLNKLRKSRADKGKLRGKYKK